MVTVASRELKNRLGKYLRLVRAGETIQITDRGKAFARVLPAASPEQQETAELLSNLLRKGGITLGAGRFAGKARPTVLKPGKSIARMVAEDRR